jgi:lipopolysaccharide/colanic/teichoic acid biosynthesis glycosyltransferase
MLCVGIAITILSPVFVIVALVIWLESGRPILFAQLRLGQRGEPFRMYKFRKFGPNCGNDGSPLTLASDERMTTAGRFLAATKLDELPQLWNVLRGDMSLVGPRPESLSFSDCFRDGFEKVLEHKPGVFGPRQRRTFIEKSCFRPRRESTLPILRAELSHPISAGSLAPRTSSQWNAGPR